MVIELVTAAFWWQISTLSGVKLQEAYREGPSRRCVTVAGAVNEETNSWEG
jgi:hypothetical protein